MERCSPRKRGAHKCLNNNLNFQVPVEVKKKGEMKFILEMNGADVCRSIFCHDQYLRTESI